MESSCTTERKPMDDSATSCSLNYCIDLSRQFQKVLLGRKQEVWQQKNEQQQLQQPPQQRVMQQQDTPTASKVVMQPCEIRLSIRLETWLTEDGTLIVRPSIDQSAEPSKTQAAKSDSFVNKSTLTTTMTTNTADGDADGDEETPVCDCSAAEDANAAAASTAVCHCDCCHQRPSEEVLYDQVAACLPEPSGRKLAGKSSSSRKGRKQRQSSASSASENQRQQQQDRKATFYEAKQHQQQLHHRQHHHHHHRQHQQQQQQQQQSSRDRTNREMEPRMRAAVKPSIDDVGDLSGRISDDIEDQSSAEAPVVAESQASSSVGCRAAGDKIGPSGRKW